MNKNKINFKLLNILISLIIIYIIYLSGGIIGGIIGKILSVSLPIILAFAFAYAIHPLLKWLESKKIPKALGIIIIVVATVLLIVGLISFIVPLVSNQIASLTGSIINFVTDKSFEYNIDLNYFVNNLTQFNTIISNFSKFVSDSAVAVINISIEVLTVFVIAFILSIYLLSDMDKIRNGIKKFLIKHNNKTFNYVKKIDSEIKNYFIGLTKFIFIQFIEYTVVYYLIGHPYFLLMGILASITTIIPYFGGIFANIIAVITALLVSPKVFILTVIVAFICPNIDGYIISPKIYGKTNKVPPILLIFSVFALGKLFGIVGIIISLPLTIILLTTYKFYKKDIENKIKEIKNKKSNQE